MSAIPAVQSFRDARYAVTTMEVRAVVDRFPADGRLLYASPLRGSNTNTDPHSVSAAAEASCRSVHSHAGFEPRQHQRTAQ
ncbi:hypothetical protein BaRGS_00006828 [Batillaria attramentaria]|uniref:Uncharacterized protein n=1 Tax=Batillaria attramentaria TaxID=370345 RepID=A0ABD0LRF8_9CAEN